MTTKAELLKLVRLNCSECLGGHRAHLNLSVNNPSEIEGCTSPACSLFPYRFGKDPSPSKGGRDMSQNLGVYSRPGGSKRLKESDLDVFLVPEEAA